MELRRYSTGDLDEVLRLFYDAARYLLTNFVMEKE